MLRIVVGLSIGTNPDPTSQPSSDSLPRRARHFLVEITTKRWQTDSSQICIEMYFKATRGLVPVHWLPNSTAICGFAVGAMFGTYAEVHSISRIAPIIRRRLLPINLQRLRFKHARCLSPCPTVIVGVLVKNNLGLVERIEHGIKRQQPGCRYSSKMKLIFRTLPWTDFAKEPFQLIRRLICNISAQFGRRLCPLATFAAIIRVVLH